MLFPRSCFLFGLLLAIWVLHGEGKIYSKDIKRRTPKGRRLWGGMETNTGDNFGGWLVHIRESDGTFACGGAYYSPLLVITSANCIYPHRNKLEGATVEGTAISKCDTDNAAEIDTIQFPKQFVYKKLFMDVALVRLRAPIKGRLTEFIELCTHQIDPGTPTMIFGWGHDKMRVEMASLPPRNASVSVLEIKLCRRWFGKKLKLSSSSFCAKQPKDPKACLYDGGSPMVYKNELCGLVSSGSTCKNTSYPGVYTKMNKRVNNFIRETEAAIRRGDISRRRRSFVSEELEDPDFKLDNEKTGQQAITIDPFEGMEC